MNEKKGKILRKIFTMLGVSSVAFTFQACYGMPPIDGEGTGFPTLESISGKVTSATTNKPIVGIKVTAGELSDTTKSDGSYYIEFSNNSLSEVNLVAEDVDGAEHGSYATKSKTVTLMVDDRTVENIELELNN